MSKKTKIYGSALLIAFLFINTYFFQDSIRLSLKSLLPDNAKIYVKELFFGKQFLKEVSHFKNSNYNQKILPATEFVGINFKKITLKDLDVLEQTHYDKINNKKSNTKTFYLDKIKNDLILATVKGNIFIFKKGELKNKTKISNNLNKLNATHLLDIAIIKDYIYVSFREEPENSKCSYFHLVKAKFNKEYLKFENFFSPKRCTINNYGGRISSGKFNNKDGIILTTGATGNEERHFAQDPNSHLGKILFFSFDEKDFKIISKGHRNPQGLFVENEIILATEHGPYGGDEINHIKQNGNYGWPISSYGEGYKFYNKTHNKNFFEYKKSHENNDFIEPIFTFVPSIGISEIIKIPNKFSKYWQNNYFITSLAGVSLYRVEFDKSYTKIKYLEKIIALERIRDIAYLDFNNTFYLALETTGQLGLLSNEHESSIK